MTAAPIAAVTSETAARESRKLAFTPLSLKGLPIPETGQRDYWDNSVAGFGLRVSYKGTKSWIGITRVLEPSGEKRLARFTLGNYAQRDCDPGLTLASARTAWAALRKRIKKGEDPRQTAALEEAAAQQRNAQTFKAVAEAFMAQHHPRGKKTLKPSTARRYRGLLFSPDLESWHTRPLSSLTRADVIAYLHGMQRRGVGVSGNRGLSVIRKLMKWSHQQGLIDHLPTDNIDAPAAETPRSRHLFGDYLSGRPSEVGLLWRALGEVGPLGNMVKLLLLTGQREGEVARMTDRELIDLDGADPRWYIPGTRTKNSKDHVLPLPPMVVQILQHIPRHPRCPFVFSTNGVTSFSGFTNFKKRIDRAIVTLKTAEPDRYAGQFEDPWTFHDLRRTFKTGLAELKVRADVRDGLLNHSRTGVDKHYDLSNLHGPKREGMAVWEAHIKAMIDADNAAMMSTPNTCAKKP